jgi:hypothetical protein
LLAMVVNDNACELDKRGALEAIASNRASTGRSYSFPGLREEPNKRPRISEAFYLGFNRFNSAASIPEKVRT